MNREDIIRMAREAGAGHTFRYSGNNPRRSVYRFHNTELERFAALVAEDCAKVADQAEPYQAADLIRARWQA